MGNDQSSYVDLSDLPEDVADELVDTLVSTAVEELVADDDANSGVIEELASEVVDELNRRNPDLTRKSRPVLEALSDFMEEKLDEVDSESHYRTKFEYIKSYFEEEVVARTTDDLTSEDIEGYRAWRKHESLDREEPLSDNTLSDDMYLFGEFVEYMIRHNMAPIRFEKSVEIPGVDYKNGEGVDNKKLDPDVAKAAREYMWKYEYASVEHVVMELYCECGTRKSGARSLDIDDFTYDDQSLEFVHRDATELKKDEESERDIELYDDVPEIIEDYIEETRSSVTDDAGREPLLVADDGDDRISLSMLKKISYKWTRPCKVGLDCPHDKDPEVCEASQKNNSAYKCPSSRAPHHIRAGYITDQRNRGVSAEAVDQRCDVSPRVQRLHYDLPSSEEARERHTDEFKQAEDDPDSGFGH